MRFLAALGIVMLAAGCGGAPVGEKVPRPDKGAMALGAAAAATAATLADPDAAGKKPESKGDDAPPIKRYHSKETAPEAVLDRAENEEDLPPASPTRGRPERTAGQLGRRTARRTDAKSS